ncbi:MAG: CoA-binding protein [Anaerolineae bacterium]
MDQHLITTQEDLIEEFINLRTWALVGASNNREKYGNIIFRNLREAGYHVYPVNPHATEIEGVPCYPSLADLPEKPAVVDIVVPPQVTVEVIKECARLGIERVWIQPGAESEEAIRTSHELGLKVVHHRCAMKHRKRW